MIAGVSFQDPIFVNTLGHTAGLFLFGLLIFLLLRGRKTSGARDERAAFVAASLAFLWNFGSLLGLALIQRDGGVPDLLVALNFSVLSLLPAVLFSVLLKDRSPGLVGWAYAVSSCAVVLHFAELWLDSPRLHETALFIVTAGFTILSAFATLLLFRGESRPPLRSFLTDTLCLALFAFSFLHFGYGHSRTAWTDEVAWHHAGIPLVLIVLLRDYRLLVAETVLRFVANLGLAGLFAAALYFVIQSGSLAGHAQGNGFLAALLVAAACGSLIAFAYLRTGLQRLLTRFVFARGDIDVCRDRILQAAAEAVTEEALLERTAALIAQFAESERFELTCPGATERDFLNESWASTSRPWAELQLPLRFSRGDTVALALGRRHASRRYANEDIAALQSLARLVVEQVERLRAHQLQTLAHQAELRALQAQVNPHFLFNALNTLYGIISRESFEARRLVLNLADLFRYCLRHDRHLTPLGEELEIVQAYLEIEALRLGNRLSFSIQAEPELRVLKIPVLSVQPLVENAIKHGISKRAAAGQITVAARVADGILAVTVRDNGPGWEAHGATSGLGIGLDNVRGRIRLCCRAGSDLKIESNAAGSAVTLLIVLESFHESDHPTRSHPASQPAARA